MKKLFFVVLMAVMAMNAFAVSVGSPNQRIKVVFDLSLKDSVPSYRVFFDDKEVIAKSNLGFLLEGDIDLNSGFALKNVDIQSFSSKWSPILGQYAEIEDIYNQCVINLQQPSTGRAMRIVFRLYDEGIAFRYEFDRQENLGYFRIKDEVTQFAMTGDHTAWWIPGAFDSNEFFYTKNSIAVKKLGQNSIFKKLFKK